MSGGCARTLELPPQPPLLLRCGRRSGARRGVRRASRRGRPLVCDLAQPPGVDLVTPGQAPGWEEEMLGDFPKLGHQKPSTLAPTYGVADRARAERGGAGAPQSRMSSRTRLPALRCSRPPLGAPRWPWAPQPGAQPELDPTGAGCPHCRRPPRGWDRSQCRSPGWVGASPTAPRSHCALYK